jgi:hypothetical protein
MSLFGGWCIRLENAANVLKQYGKFAGAHSAVEARKAPVNQRTVSTINRVQVNGRDYNSGVACPTQ